MRVGVIGCGYWGSKHVRVLNGLAEVEQVVVIEHDAHRRSTILSTFPRCQGFSDLEDALDEIDALVVVTPPSSHAAIAERAITAGKHVLVEKPLATTPDDARTLIDLAEKHEVILMTGHTFVYNPAVRRLREAVVGAELGRVLYVDAARLNLGLYQGDVNVIWDLAPHDISIVNHVLDETPTDVEAWGDAHAGSAVEDVAYLRLWYPNRGVSAQIHVSWLDPCKVRRVTVVGSEKMLVYNDLSQDQRIRIYDRGVSAAESSDSDLHAYPMSYRYGAILSPFISGEEPLQVQDRHFIECILFGWTPLSDGHNGLAVVETITAAQRSLRMRSSVELSTV